MERLIAGVACFQQEVYPAKREMFERLAGNQAPKILFLTCVDSRVDPNLITQRDPGELFICRNLGNVTPPYGAPDGSVATVMEYAVSVLAVEHIIVCGHSSCGAIKRLLDPRDDLQAPQATRWLRYAETARRVALSLHDDGDESSLLRMATEQNVIAQLTNLRTYPEVASQMAVRKLALHGWYYDIGTGDVNVFDETSAAFTPLVGTTKTSSYKAAP